MEKIAVFRKGLYFKPTAMGDITWTVTIEDNDADVDQATAVTTVRQ